MNYTQHVAAEPFGRKQLCARCGGVLIDHTATKHMPLYWTTGALVYQRGDVPTVYTDSPLVGVTLNECPRRK